MRLPSPSPSSRLAELRIALPPWCLRPASTTSRLGRVEHERQARLRREAARDLVHVEGAVAADVVDAHVEDVRAFLHLLARHQHAGVPVGFEHRLLELPRAVGVGALADREVRELLVERHVRVDRRAARLELGRAHDRRARDRAARSTAAQVLGRRAAAAADDVEAELADEALVRVGEQLRREVVVRVAVDDRRQARVRAGTTGTCARAARGSAGARSSRPDRSRSSCR